MGKDGLRISPDVWRRSRAPREGLKMNSDNTIPERTLQLTLISIEMNNGPDRCLTDLAKSSP
jgi:hypothetical protein